MIPCLERCFYLLEITHLSVSISMLAPLLRRQSCGCYLEQTGSIQKKSGAQDMGHKPGET
jgi:hypothetical protein